MATKQKTSRASNGVRKSAGNGSTTVKKPARSSAHAKVTNGHRQPVGAESDITVAEAQRYLQEFGYLEPRPMPKDPFEKMRDMALPKAEAGVLDDATAVALSNFQRMYQLPVTGELDAPTKKQMRLPRCGVPDRPSLMFRSLVRFVVQGSRWNTNNLTYRFQNFSGDLTQVQIRAAIVNAFGQWSRVTPLNFTEVGGAADILISFVTGNHGDGYAFDGVGSVLAHAFYPPPGGGGFAGDMHFDDAEGWSVNSPPTGTDLETVALHELGHALGLNHSLDTNAVMYAFYGGIRRDLRHDDLDGIRSIYGARSSAIMPVPGWFGWENQGADVAVGDINGNGRPDILVFHIDNPGGENHGYYRVGWNLNAAGQVTGGWSPIYPVPGWFGAEDQGAGVALADLNGNGRLDLIVFHIDNPGGENHGYYRVGWNLNAAGQVTGGWSPIMAIPGWFGAEDQGGGIAVADLNGNGRPDLIVFHIDNPGGENHGYYRVGWNLNALGQVTGGWSPIMAIPGWFGAEDQGGGVAIADTNGNGRPDLIVFHLDNPAGENHGYYRVGRDLNANGVVTGGWGPVIAVPGWFGAQDQGAGIAAANIGGNGRTDLVVFHVDNPGGDNHGYYRVVWDL